MPIKQKPRCHLPLPECRFHACRSLGKRTTAWQKPACRGRPVENDHSDEKWRGVFVVIYCTTDPAKVDAKTRSKWSRALRYAANFNYDGKSLKSFIRATCKTVGAMWTRGVLRTSCESGQDSARLILPAAATFWRVWTHSAGIFAGVGI